MPPSYIGYARGEGGMLSKIRDSPECIVLFDEIEKAIGFNLNTPAENRAGGSIPRVSAEAVSAVKEGEPEIAGFASRVVEGETLTILVS